MAFKPFELGDSFSLRFKNNLPSPQDPDQENATGGWHLDDAKDKFQCLHELAHLVCAREFGPCPEARAI